MRWVLWRMALYLSCHFCGRKQADGLLSRRYWGHLDISSNSYQVCPTCKEQKEDWQEIILLSLAPLD